MDPHPAPAAPAAGPAVRGTRLLASVFLMLGILGMLRTGPHQLDDRLGGHLFVYTTHALMAVVQIGIGLVGIAAATEEGRARHYLAGLAALLVSWAVAGVILDGDPSDAVNADPWFLALNGAGALVAAGLLMVARRGDGPGRP